MVLSRSGPPGSIACSFLPAVWEALCLFPGARSISWKYMRDEYDCSSGNLELCRRANPCHHQHRTQTMLRAWISLQILECKVQGVVQGPFCHLARLLSQLWRNSALQPIAAEIYPHNLQSPNEGGIVPDKELLLRCR